MLDPQLTINCKGQLLYLKSPQVMGILNATPDSFYDGGKYNVEKNALIQVEKMQKEGAVIIDIGGMSSRPGAEMVSVEKELSRVIPVINILIKEFPEIIISIDTLHSQVAREAVENGARLINDISGGSVDPFMFETVSKLNVPYILMHMQGTPQTMQQAPHYEDVCLEVLDYFIEKVGLLRKLGVKDVILDPGFGFGKTIPQNFELLKKMHVFQILDCPLLAGISRKSMICKILKLKPVKALNGTSALHIIALQQGAKILRVHDVKEAKEVIKLWETLEEI